MKRFEYKIKQLGCSIEFLETELMKLGNDGWQVIQISGMSGSYVIYCIKDKIN